MNKVIELPKLKGREREDNLEETEINFMGDLLSLVHRILFELNLQTFSETINSHWKNSTWARNNSRYWQIVQTALIFFR